MKVAFEPVDDVTRVELNLQHLDAPVVVEGVYETDDQVLIAELDEHPLVRRAEKGKKKPAAEPDS